MNNKRLNILLLVVLGLVSCFLFLFFQENTKKKSDALGVLVLNQGNASLPNFKRGFKSNIKSLWDTNDKNSFINHGHSLDQTLEEVTTQKEIGDTPVNPQTGKSWSDAEMQQFEELAKIFPENDLIPRRMSQEEKHKKNLLAEKFDRAQNAVDNQNYTRGDLKVYFDRQKKLADDRIQILEYMAELAKEDGDLSEQTQFQKMLEFNKDQIKQMVLVREELEKKLN